MLVNIAARSSALQSQSMQADAACSVSMYPSLAVHAISLWKILALHEQVHLHLALA